MDNNLNGKPVFIFVEKDVLAEFRTYQKNKNIPEVTYASVDDVHVFAFLEEVLALPFNNPVAPFETSTDITNYLREQWAGLFQRLLQESARQKEVRLIEDMTSITATLKQLVTFLSSEKSKGDRAIRDILLSNHPMFQQLRKELAVPYRVFFTNHEEFVAWIRQRSFQPLPSSDWDDPGIEEWSNTVRETKLYLYVNRHVFDEDDRLRVFTPEEWDENFIKVRTWATPEQPPVPPEDEVPF